MQDIKQIYEEYFETVNKYLFCLTHDNDISEELTQETFYKAVQKINTYKGKCKMSVWLCQIAKNLWYDQCRKNKKVINIEENLFDVQAPESTENQVISNDEKISLYKKMQKLDEKTREVIYLRITGELTFKEIATILNKTENWWQLLKYSILASIKTTNFNGNQCFYLANFKNPYSYNSEGIYINKETGFPLSTIAYEYKKSNEISDEFPKREPLHEYVLELNTVMESDFSEPNINEYEVQQ